MTNTSFFFCQVSLPSNIFKDTGKKEFFFALYTRMVRHLFKKKYVQIILNEANDIAGIIYYYILFFLLNSKSNIYIHNIFFYRTFVCVRIKFKLFNFCITMRVNYKFHLCLIVNSKFQVSRYIYVGIYYYFFFAKNNYSFVLKLITNKQKTKTKQTRVRCN